MSLALREPVSTGPVDPTKGRKNLWPHSPVVVQPGLSTFNFHLSTASSGSSAAPMPLTIDVLTLFPRMLDGFFAESILGKGIAAGHLAVNVHDLRAWATDKHRTADDRPFGGGAGMMMK